MRRFAIALGLASVAVVCEMFDGHMLLLLLFVLVHVLRVAGVNDRDGIVLYRVRKVPLIRVRHVVARPAL